MTMSADAMKKVVHDYVERVWNRGDVTAFDELVTPAYQYHVAGQAFDLAATKEVVGVVRGGLPDWHADIVATIVDGNTVAIRWEMSATHLGHYLEFPPTGNRMVQFGSCFYQLEGGRIAHEWEYADMLGMLIRMGAVTMRYGKAEDWLPPGSV